MASRPMIDTDTWWHLRTGQWIVDHHALPEVDRFSFTRIGEPWYYPGWLAEIVMVDLFSLGGLPALNLLFTGLIFLTFIVVFFTLEGDPFLRAAILVLAAGASEIYWSARPQVFTFFFSACFYLCLRKFLLGNKNALWLLPLIMLLWVNIHAGFAAGFILLLIALVGQGLTYLVQRPPKPPEALRKLGWLVGVLFACAAAAVVNPRGIAILGGDCLFSQANGRDRLLLSILHQLHGFFSMAQHLPVVPRRTGRHPAIWPTHSSIGHAEMVGSGSCRAQTAIRG